MMTILTSLLGRVRRPCRSVLPMALTLPGALWLGSSRLQAKPSFGENCLSCHSTVKNGMTLTGHQSLTNLGAGVLKAYQVTAGRTTVISIRVNETNAYGGNYGLSLSNLGAGGRTNAANHLSYVADTTWANQGTWYTVGPTSNSPRQWTNNLTVQAATPADTYLLSMRMAGRDNGGTLWGQLEQFYVQVVPAPPPSQPLLTNFVYSGTSASVTVSTVQGATYYLEYKTALTNTTWSPAAQTPGDGTLKTLTDPAATGLQRFYRVRVQ